MKLSRKAVDIGPEHVGHTIAFVEVFDPPPNDDVGIVCAVCRTCVTSASDDDVMLVAVIDDQEAIAQIRAETGELRKVYIDPHTVTL